jgi:hypothetical protein
MYNILILGALFFSIFLYDKNEYILKYILTLNLEQMKTIIRSKLKNCFDGNKGPHEVELSEKA